MTTKSLLNRLIERQDLRRDEAESLMGAIMSGELSDPEIAGFLTALRMKGETVDEITGFVSVMRAKAVKIEPKRADLVDTCGTGGDAQHTFNISTAAAIVSAGMGIPVAKHGNRAVSSQCGSADVLEALGVNINMEPTSVAELIDQVGIGFLFAPQHHPAMKHVAPARKALGTRTIFNLLGPLTNPAGVRRQLIGVFDRTLTEVIARVLHALGSEKVFVVHGLDGTDEVSITGETVVSVLLDKHVRTFTFSPEDAGLDRADASQLAGGTAEENAESILEILRGRKGPRRDAVVLNAAFVAVLADKAKHVADGVRLAAETIDSGRALETLDSLVEASNAIGERNVKRA